MPVASTSRETLEDQVAALKSAQVLLHPTRSQDDAEQHGSEAAHTWYRRAHWRGEEKAGAAVSHPADQEAGALDASKVEPEIIHLLHVLPPTEADAVHKEFCLSLFETACSAIIVLLGGTSFAMPEAPLQLGAEAFVAPATSSAHDYILQWTAALCGLIPHILFEVEASRHRSAAPQATDEGRSGCAQVFRAFVARRRDALIEIERHVAQRNEANAASANGAEEDVMLDWLDQNPSTPKAPIHCALFRTLLDLDLVDALDSEGTAAASFSSVDPNLIAEAGGRDQVEALISSKLQSSAEDVELFLSKVVTDYSSHLSLAACITKSMASAAQTSDLDSVCPECITKSMTSAAQTSDLDSVCRVAKACFKTPQVVDIWLLYTDAMDILVPIGTLLDKTDLAESADEPSILRNIVLFAQWILQRIVIVRGHSILEDLARQVNFLPRFVSASTALPSISQLQPNEGDLVGRWIHALFDSEGISDDLMRDSPPQILMRLAPLLFCQSIEACTAGVIDLETLRGGLDYFAQDLLCFALPAGLGWVARDVHRRTVRTLPSDGVSAKVASIDTSVNGPRETSTHFEVLKQFLLAENADQVVTQLVAPLVRNALDAISLSQSTGVTESDLDSLRLRVDAALGQLPVPHRGDAWTAQAFASSLSSMSPQLQRAHQSITRSLSRCESASWALAEHFHVGLITSTEGSGFRRSLAALIALDRVRQLSSHTRAGSGVDLLVRVLRDSFCAVKHDVDGH
ncbi:Mediator complex, subunit Med5, fungi [Ceraceosorus bombacis]|uniref:Mediator of RNA polymerase II transcription subunit 5 n=1 Tax=Ceraceosorus bombacis TaxID=401625 RepID=A0A0P1BRG7_9BASI|nr:Mediator complex, subunit Med5, fungi [Ceraceosorus bombacis]